MAQVLHVGFAIPLAKRNCATYFHSTVAAYMFKYVKGIQPKDLGQQHEP